MSKRKREQEIDPEANRLAKKIKATKAELERLKEQYEKLPSIQIAQWSKLANLISENSEEYEDIDQVLAWIEERKKDETPLFLNLQTESDFGEIVVGLGTQSYQVKYTSRDGSFVVASHSSDEFFGDVVETMGSSTDGLQNMDKFGGEWNTMCAKTDEKWHTAVLYLNFANELMMR